MTTRSPVALIAAALVLAAGTPAKAADDPASLAFLDGLEHLTESRAVDRIDVVSKALGLAFVEDKDGGFARVEVRPAWLFQGNYSRAGDPPGKNGTNLTLSLTPAAGCVRMEDVTARFGAHYMSVPTRLETFRKDGGIIPQLAYTVFYDYPGKPSLKVVFDPDGKGCFNAIELLSGPK
jgi:hypothetical protein